MGRVGQFLVMHLLARPNRYQVYFSPWDNDYMAGYWPDEINALRIDDPAAYDLDQVICFCSIHDARQKRIARRLTPWLFYELNSLPEPVVEDVNTNDQVFVTSSFVQRVFVECGVTIPVSILGHGVDPALYRYLPRTKGDPFTFLCVAEHTPRKNLPMLIRSFERAFRDQSGVRLKLKLGLHGEGDLRELITQPDKIVLATEELEQEADMVELYNQAHCFVLPTRAEGFGMPILEAMATGLPVIVTNYSGHLDFCHSSNSYLLDCKGLVDSDPACFPYVESQWADPDEAHLTHLLREVYDRYDEALAKGVAGAKTIAESWSWDQQLSRVFP
jgi:glycosyltransferase involved in cell wall biosynthesis